MTANQTSMPDLKKTDSEKIQGIVTAQYTTIIFKQ